MFITRKSKRIWRVTSLLFKFFADWDVSHTYCDPSQFNGKQQNTRFTYKLLWVWWILIHPPYLDRNYLHPTSFIERIFPRFHLIKLCLPFYLYGAYHHLVWWVGYFDIFRILKHKSSKTWQKYILFIFILNYVPDKEPVSCYSYLVCLNKGLYYNLLRELIYAICIPAQHKLPFIQYLFKYFKSCNTSLNNSML